MTENHLSQEALNLMILPFQTLIGSFIDPDDHAKILLPLSLAHSLSLSLSRLMIQATLPSSEQGRTRTTVRARFPLRARGRSS
jgi:hypothetical protein